MEKNYFVFLSVFINYIRRLTHLSWGGQHSLEDGLQILLRGGGRLSPKERRPAFLLEVILFSRFNDSEIISLCALNEN